MAERAAVDASSLIFLARANLIELLQLVAPAIAVPFTVASEIGRRGPQDLTARALAETPWLQVVDAPVVPSVIQNWDLGPGESSVLAWCSQHFGSEGIIDDLAARRCASMLRIPVRGTLGLVLLGKQTGFLPTARPVLEFLRSSGMYLSDRVLDKAPRTVGE